MDGLFYPSAKSEIPLFTIAIPLFTIALSATEQLISPRDELLSYLIVFLLSMNDGIQHKKKLNLSAL